MSLHPQAVMNEPKSGHAPPPVLKGCTAVAISVSRNPPPPGAPADPPLGLPWPCPTETHWTWALADRSGWPTLQLGGPPAGQRFCLGGRGGHTGNMPLGDSGWAHLFKFGRGYSPQCLSTKWGVGRWQWDSPSASGAASAPWRLLHCPRRQPSPSVPWGYRGDDGNLRNRWAKGLPCFIR